MSAWWETYLGADWTPDHDCWAFARRVWSERFGRAVPPVPFDAADPRSTRRAIAGAGERARWHEAAPPCEGDAVLMARGREPCHVGIWIEGDRVLHCVGGSGVVCVPVGRLAAMGYRVTGIYRREAV